MKQFPGREIVRFLQAVDRHLDEPFRLDVIGGAAALLSFRIDSGTVDIDAANNVAGLQNACRAARDETGLDIPVSTAGIYDGPYFYERRMKRVPIRGLRKLQVFVPEKHDWALMKIVRLIEKDIEDIREVDEKAGFRRAVFLKRFLEEMTHVTGRREDLMFSFLTMMEELFGSEEAARMEKAIRTHKKWK
jgi:hypothetical protein